MAIKEDMMLRMDGDDELEFLQGSDGMSDDAQLDKQARHFLEDLKKVGPYSKQILNYSYPPLLYQRGDEDDEEEQADLGDDNYDDDKDIEELIKGGKDKGDLYQKLRKAVDDEKGQYYYEEVDDDGNVYLVEAQGKQTNLTFQTTKEKKEKKLKIKR